MAHRRSFRGRGISDSQRRKKTWISIKTAVAAAGADSSFSTSIVQSTAATDANPGNFRTSTFAVITDELQTVGDELSNLPEECTILRARGSLLFPKNTIIAGASGPVEDQYAWGFGVTDIRSIVGLSSPNPIVDSDWDGWMFLRQSALPPVEATSGIVDVKAMRKIRGGDALFFTAVGMNGRTTITPAGDFVFDMRLLILLP